MRKNIKKNFLIFFLIIFCCLVGFGGAKPFDFDYEDETEEQQQHQRDVGSIDHISHTETF